MLRVNRPFHQKKSLTIHPHWLLSNEVITRNCLCLVFVAVPSTSGSAYNGYNEFGYNGHWLQRTDLCAKIIDNDVQNFGWNEHPSTTNHLHSILLLDVSGFHCIDFRLRCNWKLNIVPFFALSQSRTKPVFDCLGCIYTEKKRTRRRIIRLIFAATQYEQHIEFTFKSFESDVTFAFAHRKCTFTAFQAVAPLIVYT